MFTLRDFVSSIESFKTQLRFKMSYRKRKRTAPAWQHFTANDDFSAATCNICLESVKTLGGSTSKLIRHLLVIHKIDITDQSSSGKNKLRTLKVNLSANCI